MNTTVHPRPAALLLAAAALAAAAAGCTESQTDQLGSGGYWVTSLKLGGPAAIASGGSARYTATVSIARTAHLESAERRELRLLVKNDLATDQEIARVPIVWGPYDVAPKTVPVDIACKRVGPGFGVSGNQGASQKGGAVCRPGGGNCMPNPAVAYAMLDSVASAGVAITCTIPSSGGDALATTRRGS